MLPAPPPAVPGTELAAGYRVIGHMNRGKRLDVYDAWSEERSSRCVLKTLRPDRAAEPRARRALLQEGRLLLRFTHPHLVRAYELTGAMDDGRPVLVLETLGGETLSYLIRRLNEADRRLPLVDTALLGLQLSSALAYLHRHGWLHLDMKPSNIVAEAGRARLIDLSIARRPGRVRAGSGTMEYLSPEQARGGMITTAADVWGLGAVLFTALAGEPPYGRDFVPTATGEDTGEDPDETASTDATWTDTSDTFVYPQLDRDPDPVRRRRRVPAALGGLVDACLHREPEGRPSLAEVTQRLEAWLPTRHAGPA